MVIRSNKGAVSVILFLYKTPATGLRGIGGRIRGMEYSIIATIAQEYYDLACSFCDYLEHTVITADCIDDLMTYLMKLYMHGIALPNVEPDSIKDVEKPYFDPFLKIECEEAYYMLFDPFVEENPVGGSLHDDFFDIYSDLKKAACAYEAGHVNNAIWEWSFGLNHHWGHHLLDALALNARLIKSCDTGILKALPIASTVEGRGWCPSIKKSLTVDCDNLASLAKRRLDHPRAFICLFTFFCTVESIARVLIIMSPSSFMIARFFSAVENGLPYLMNDFPFNQNSRPTLCL